MKQWLWPDIENLEKAKNVARNGALTAFFIAFVTALVTFLQTQGLIHLFILGREAYIDAGLFLIIGIGIFRMSRIAAAAGLLLYIAEQYLMIQSGAGRGSLMMVLFTLFFLAAVRATFAFHRFKKQGMQPGLAADSVNILTGQPRAHVPEAPRPVLGSAAAPKKLQPALLLGLAAVLILGAAGWWMGRAFLKNMHLSGSKAVTPESRDASSRTFRMKNGETIRGRVIQEDPLYYIIKRGGKEDVLARQDISSVE